MSAVDDPGYSVVIPEKLSSHVSQLLACSMAENLPLSQALQTFPPGLKVPGWQLAHSSDASSLDPFPGAQSRHIVAFADANLPGSQARQVMAFCDDEANPSRQGSQL
jgi:hypothetical protein